MKSCAVSVTQEKSRVRSEEGLSLPAAKTICLLERCWGLVLRGMELLARSLVFCFCHIIKGTVALLPFVLIPSSLYLLKRSI